MSVSLPDAISTMSSSNTEVTSNRVPTLFIKMRMHIRVWRLVSLNGTQSLTEAVAEDVVDILGQFHNDTFDFNSVSSARFFQQACSSEVATHQDT